MLRRFQGILGKRRAPENIALLNQAHAAYMGLKRSAKSIRGRGANIFTQWVGDPDALGSAVLLKAILREPRARRRCASSPAASATRRTATWSSAADSCCATRTASGCAAGCTAWSTPRRRSAC